MKEFPKEVVKVGLIRGRHEMPVSAYIFDEIEDMFDYKSIYDHIADFIRNEVGIECHRGSGIHTNKGKKVLIVYVTGLTSVACALVDVCNKLGVPLGLMHYDRNADSYRMQVLGINESVWH